MVGKTLSTIWKFLMKILLNNWIEKFNRIFNYLWKVVKNRAFGNTIIFLQNFSPFRGPLGAYDCTKKLPPKYKYWTIGILNTCKYSQWCLQDFGSGEHFRGSASEGLWAQSPGSCRILENLQNHSLKSAKMNILGYFQKFEKPCVSFSRVSATIQMVE